ncbi:PucR family transcriptional regulator [Streptomyces sp. NPDC002533]
MNLSGVAASLRVRLPELAEEMAQRIRSEVDAYQDGTLISLDSLRSSCSANADLVLAHLRRGSTPEAGAADETGRVRAEQGVPLADTLRAYRIGSEFLWAEILAEARTRPEISDDLLVSESAKFWSLSGLYMEAVAVAYRETAAELTSRGQLRRSALVEALFTGVIAEGTLWEAARELGLPEQGPYAVAVAEAGASGGEPLVGVEASLRRAELPSVWRLLPDQQLVLIALPSDGSEKTCLRILRGSRARVGFSPRFDSLQSAPQALRFARLALSVLPGAGPGVARFDDHPLSMVVVAAPAEAARLVEVTLQPVLDLPAAERSRLLQTLEQWFASGGSVNAAAQGLFVHPNTVRYRLRRVEELTGRPLSDPRMTADVGAALAVVRRSDRPLKRV